MVFNNLAAASFNNIVFNHGNLAGGEAGAGVRDQYQRQYPQ